MTVYDGTDCNKVSASAARIDKAFDTLAAAHDAVLNSAGLGAGVNTADLTEEERQAVVAREGRREARKERQQALVQHLPLSPLRITKMLTASLVLRG